jgi:uncharacterized Rossmann fold enzyme
MGHPRHREGLAQLRARCDALEACMLVARLLEAVRGRRVCVHGPLSRGPSGECEVNAGPESALALAEEFGVRLAYVTGDMDASLRLLSLARAYADVYIAHLHGDNMHLDEPRGLPILYSSQVETASPCVVAPLGYTDGDRAAVLAMALGAAEVLVIGFGGQPFHPHKDYEPGGAAKDAKLRLAQRMILAAASSLGYVAVAPSGGRVIRLKSGG